jgi:methyl-accepting chemotaxis protein
MPAQPLSETSSRPRRLKTLRLVPRIMLLSVSGILLLGACVTCVAWYVLEAGATRAALERVETNMRVAWDVVRANGRNFSSVDGKLLLDGHVLNDDVAMVDKVKSLIGGTCTIFLNDLRITTNVQKPDGTRAVGTRLAKSAAYESVIERKTPFRGEVEILGTPFMTAYDPILDSSGKLLGILYVGIKKADFQEAAYNTLWTIVYSTLAVVLLIMAVSYLAARNLARPLKASIVAMKRLALGDLAVDTPGTGRTDEVGEMANALLILKEQAIEKNRLLALQEAARQEAIEARKQTMRDMADVVEKETTAAVNAVGDTAGHVRVAAEEMSQFASVVSIDTQSVATASEQALASAQTVSSAAEELNASIQEINAQVSHTADVARQAVASGDIATTTVQSLTDAIVKISDVTKLIGDIASQTNLLALNATIEAARAGEAGRGFAVVASEVKNLAAQTARSTEDINRQVADIQRVSTSAAGAMADVGARIGEINQSTAAILMAIKQQSTATQEITRNIGETALSAREVSARIQNVSAGATKVGSRAENVRHSIAEITESIAGLRSVLVRAVRTSADDTDRRKYPRYSMTVQAEILDVSSKRLTGELVDISEAGAKLSFSSGMLTGEKGYLRLDGLSLPLPFMVRARQDEMLHVEFELTEAQHVIYRQWFNQRVAGKQALAS